MLGIYTKFTDMNITIFYPYLLNQSNKFAGQENRVYIVESL